MPREVVGKLTLIAADSRTPSVQTGGPIGSLVVALFSPISSSAYFVPAVDLEASYLKSISPLLTWAPIELARALVPGMRSRGDWAFIVAVGLSAVFPVAGSS